MKKSDKNSQFYNHEKLDKKIQNLWKENKIYKTKNKAKKNFYILDMFPYPSGAGLHVGHPRGYVASDVYSRFKRMQGYNVLHPMGFDAFGLPAEQYAIKNKTHPEVAVLQNIKTYKKQLSILGFDYDEDREINTTNPDYYKHTQAIFLKLYNHYYDIKTNKAKPISELIKKFEKDKILNWKNKNEKEKQDILMKYRLVYEGFSEVNWCSELGSVLANDEIIDGKSERGGYPVEKKIMRQWFMRITAYSERLLNGLNALNWPQKVKNIQNNWIGKSIGHEVLFKTDKNDDVITFTTRLDTISGVTFLALSYDHEICKKYLNQELIEEINDWKKNDAGIVDDLKEKKGFLLKDIKAIHPITSELLPIYITNYVLISYGTGAIMGVPDLDERDKEFATKYNIKIKDTIIDDANIISKKYNFKEKINYKLRDAVISRQRYWGEPIPVIYDNNGIITPLKEKDLPLRLPKVKSYEPIGNGDSPLAGIKEWVKKGYETNTMPGFAASSWYFLRYMDNKNTKELASQISIKNWKQVDVYVGGAEHATGHLLYSRFWNMFLYDIGITIKEEPFKELHNQGMILGTDNKKMSKSLGNVVNPDDFVKNYGADTFRLYEMFIGPFDGELPWNTESMIGTRRFVDRVWRLFNNDFNFAQKSNIQVKIAINKALKKVSEDIINFSFNTAVSSMMIMLNEIEKYNKEISKTEAEIILKMLAPFACHITDVLWQNEIFKNKKSIHISAWPKYNKKYLKEDFVIIGIQVMGKLRGEIKVFENDNDDIIKNNSIKIVEKYIDNNTIKKIIYVKNKIINIVI